MANEKGSGEITKEGATIVITHRVLKDKQNEYENWLDEIGPICRASEGILDWQIIRPIPGLTATYTVVIRYDKKSNLENWMNSDDRKRLIEKVHHLLEKNFDFYISSGLDFWFTPEGANAKLPIRWKQLLVTWSAIYPLVIIMPMLILPTLQHFGLSINKYTDTLVTTGLIVTLMVYLIMPRYTRLIQHWLFK